MTQYELPHIDELDAWSKLNTPIWVFDTDQSRICWANDSGLAFWNASSIKELGQRDFSGDSAIVKERLSVISKTICEHGRLTDTWTLYPQDQPEHVAVDFQRIQLDRDRKGLLIEVTQRLTTPLDHTYLRMFEATQATSSLITMMVLSRLRSGLSTHLCGLSFECQGAFATQR